MTLFYPVSRHYTWTSPQTSAFSPSGRIIIRQHFSKLSLAHALRHMLSTHVELFTASYLALHIPLTNVMSCSPNIWNAHVSWEYRDRLWIRTRHSSPLPLGAGQPLYPVPEPPPRLPISLTFLPLIAGNSSSHENNSTVFQLRSTSASTRPHAPPGSTKILVQLHLTLP